MSSYKEIVKSSGLIGSVQIFQLVFGLIRNKIVAVLLGTSGFGLWGLYQTYVELITSFSSLGVDQSTVRQVSKNENNKDLIGKIIVSVYFILVLTSVLAMALSIVFSKEISTYLFGYEENYKGIIIISCSLLFYSISRGQIAILNGLRRLRSLALSQIYGAILGTILSILLIFFFGKSGIPWCFFTMGLTLVITSGIELCRANIKFKIPKFQEVRQEVKILIFLGLGFGGAALVASIMTYLSRAYLNHEFNIDTVGIYQASWTISNLYVGIILTAMGVDFMPRLVKIIDNKSQVIKVINEQMELGTLLISVAISCIIIYSPIILNILYSSEFSSGTHIIRWQVLGVSIRVLGFPFGYAIMAKNKPLIYFIIQSIFWIGEFFLLILFSTLFGFNGLGVNYFVGYLVYLFIAYFVCNKLFDFHFTKLLKKILVISYSFIIISLLISNVFSHIYYGYIIGGLLIIFQIIWVNFYLKKHIGIDVISYLRKLINKL